MSSRDDAIQSAIDLCEDMIHGSTPTLAKVVDVYRKLDAAQGNERLRDTARCLASLARDNQAVIDGRTKGQISFWLSFEVWSKRAKALAGDDE